MTRYSRRHYRLVSPPADTKEQALERAIHRCAAELAIADREKEFPVLTADNARAAIDYQNERVRFHAAKKRYCEMCDEWVPAKQTECKACGAPTVKAAQ